MATSTSRKTKSSVKERFHEEALRQYKRLNILYVIAMMGSYSSAFLCVICVAIGQSQAAVASGTFSGASTLLTNAMNKTKKDQHEQMELMISTVQPKKTRKSQPQRK